MTGFPASVNLTQAPAVEGDYASTNPRVYLPGNGGTDIANFGIAWQAGAGGITLAHFAWGDLTATDSILVNNGSGAPSCMVAREEGSAIITTYLAENSMVIPQGFPVPGAIIGGDVWVRNANASAASAVGQKAYARYDTGQVMFAAAGAPPAGASFTASISGTTMTVTGTPTGLPLAVGQPVSGAGVTANTVITAAAPGGGAGAYTVNNSQTVSSEAMTTTGAVETKWYAASIGAAGALVKITNALID